MKKFKLSCIALLAFCPATTIAQNNNSFSLVADTKPLSQTNSVVMATDTIQSTSKVSVGNPPVVAQVPVEDPYKLPELEIDGINKSYNLGDMIALSIKPMQSKPEFLESVTYTWKILPFKEPAIWPDSTKIFFGTGIEKTIYTVILDASYVYVEEGGKVGLRSVSKTFQVYVGQPVANPIVTNPITPIVPAPIDIPAEIPALTGLAKLSIDWVSLIQDNQNLKEDANTMSGNFAIVAGQIERGNIREVDKIMEEIKRLNDATVKNKEAWKPWFQQMSTHIATEYSEGKLTKPDQFAKAWREISTGLATVAQ